MSARKVIKKSKHSASLWAVFYRNSVPGFPEWMRSNTCPDVFDSKAAAEKSIRAAKRKYRSSHMERVALRIRNGELVEPVRKRIIDSTPLVEGPKPQKPRLFFRIAYHIGEGYSGVTRPSVDLPVYYDTRKAAIADLNRLKTQSQQADMGYVIEAVAR